MRGVVTAALAVGLLTATAEPGLYAETRGKPYSEGQLLAMCEAVFVGEVLETKEFPAHKRVVPTKVRVRLSIKGDVPLGEMAVTPQDPGAHVYFDEEFSQAAKGRLGVFYVSLKPQPNVLMGYREVPQADPPK